MRIDLHVHTSRYSRSCSVLEPFQLARAAKAAGLDGLVITEHQCRWSAGELANLEAGGLALFAGREVDLGNVHVLLIGAPGPPPPAKEPAELAQAVRELGGATVLAHPLRYGRGLELSPRKLAPLWGLFDGVEALAGSHSPEENQAALAVCRELGLRPTGGSDAHHASEVGRFYTELGSPVHSEAELAQALRQGDFAPAARDRA